jgi:VIT1/CCC1 family predicted Fe2+/Mn2+ transporter
MKQNLDLCFLDRRLKMPEAKKKPHRTGQIGWLRATALGANDGILSTSSLVLGVAAANTHIAAEW